MVMRTVTGASKDKDGDIIKICGSEPTPFSVLKDEAIQDIENKKHSYRVGKTLLTSVNIHVVTAAGVKFLRTDPDLKITNNLDELPSC